MKNRLIALVLAALAILTLVPVPARADKWTSDGHPRVLEDLVELKDTKTRDRFKDYLYRCRDKLSRMSDLVVREQLLDSDPDDDVVRPWREACDDIRDRIELEIRRLGDEIKSSGDGLKDLRRVEYLKVMIEWYGYEAEQWERIDTVAHRLVVYHDVILDQLAAVVGEQANHLTKEETWEMDAQVAEALVNTAAIGLTVLTGDPDTALATATEVLQAIDFANGGGLKAGVFELLDRLVEERREVESFRDEYDPDEFKDDFRKAVDRAMTSDKWPRYRFYREFEKKWEEKLARFVDTYERAFQEYEKVTAPLVGRTMFREMRNLRDISFGYYEEARKKWVDRYRREKERIERELRDR